MNNIGLYAAFFIIVFIYATVLYWLRKKRATALGKYGELLIALKLKRLQKGKISEGKILKNLYIPKGENEYTEIDLIFITNRGIFVIETKNYSGWIFGNEKDQYWTAVLPNKRRYRFYNPIRQNSTHLRYLHKALGEAIPSYSIIVFSERCSLKKITAQSTVIKRNDLKRTILTKYQESEEILKPEEIERIYQKLLQYANNDKEIKRSHIENIKKKNT